MKFKGAKRRKNRRRIKKNNSPSDSGNGCVKSPIDVKSS